MKSGVVYLVRNTENDRQYVGITTQKLRLRWSAHMWLATTGLSKSDLHKDISRLGRCCFSVSVLEVCESFEVLQSAERRWIARLGTIHPIGYNRTVGGAGLSGLKHSAETRIKIGRAHIGMKRPRAGIDAGAAARRGRKINPAASAAISRPIIAAGVQYPSMRLAAAALGVAMSTISRRADSGMEGYVFLLPVKRRRRRTPEQVVLMRKVQGIRILADYVEYASLTLAAEALNVTRPAISYRISVSHSGYARL